MIPPTDSLLKYSTPVLISKTTDEKLPKQVRPSRAGPQQSSDSSPVPPPPRSSDSTEDTWKGNEATLDTIFPPREWMVGKQQWLQQVSSIPCTRTDVVRLEELLDTNLQRRQARDTGICPVRRELYTQCFDELIRQVTINCAERGLLLLRIRDEINMSFAVHETLYESSIGFGMRKALQAEQGKADTEKCTADLKNEIQDLNRELNEEKTKCDVIEQREAEKRQVEEKKFTEEIQFLKRTNQQLKNQLEGITPKK
ncbi:axonemal dynein light intermediate polypeptide 1-like [Platichthys flesus]|uniref:axonemal dynein light intermediate polypeptide 1-like n=1 Tax=Platichthys flesus TaxID=8260 RepID=UPI002DB77BEB|nr:axonemal dynein light intermediate polypeptide 1-like [Platichthys flesus]